MNKIERPKVNAKAQPKDTKTRWTIMLYIAADGLLANFGIETLKQLNQAAASAPGHDDTSRVVVAAQYSIDAPGGQVIPRYVFDKDSGGNLGQSIRDYLYAPENMTEQEALTSFLDWVYRQEVCDADNYVLILWSHGPELFMQPPSGSPTGSSASLYLTPIELRQALTDGIPAMQKSSLKIVAFDACSMSMFEMAYEIRGLAGYMVASQQEVPDLSFPYNTLVQIFRKHGNNIGSLLVLGVRSYVSTYQDYIVGKTTSMNPVTLTAIKLGACEHLAHGIRNLALSLLRSKGDPDLAAFLLRAREKARDYASGLYVDLVEFCTYLYELLYPSTVADVMSPNPTPSSLSASIEHKKKIRQACREILNALAVDEHGASPNLLLVNCSSDTRSHGMSIYLPYLSDCEASSLEQPMVKGTREVPLKGFSVALNASASGYLFSMREKLILDTESYYDELALSADTCWYEFIVHVWTRILIELTPETLDDRYSATQCAINAVRKRKTACSGPGGASAAKGPLGHGVGDEPQ